MYVLLHGGRSTYLQAVVHQHQLGSKQLPAFFALK
jgi:hypothetical protein